MDKVRIRYPVISRELEAWLVEIRRDFHRHPELGFQEKRTSRKIAEILTRLGLEVRTGVGGTGVVGLLRGKHPGKTVALRADIDALPMTEQNDVAYRSQNPGVMHACGHDAHAAIMLGAARIISESGFARTGRGNVKFFFQPAEELLGGARAMIADGAMENPSVDIVLATHVTPALPTGTLGFFEGITHSSSDRIEIFLTGRGGHAASPHLCVDPILAGAHLLTQLHSVVSRSVDPQGMAVLSIGVFEGGTAHNIIPDQTVIKGTVRALDENIRRTVKKRIHQIVRGIKQSADLKEARLDYHELCPPCPQDPRIRGFMKAAAEKMLGSKNVRDLKPSNGSEDFAFFAQRAPSCMFRLGAGGGKSGNRVFHSATFDIDESALKIGAAFISRAVLEYLAQQP